MGKNSFYNTFLAVVITMVILTLAVLACLFFGYATKDIHAQKINSTNVVLLNGKSTRDSVICTNLSVRVDSVVSVLNDINQRYPQEIDTAINKTNIWMGFWMTILTFVLMICGFWQYFRIKEDKEIQNKMQEELKRKQREVEKSQEKTYIESQISIAMRTLGAINDPILLTHIDSQKKAVKHFFDNIANLLDKYEQCFECKEKTIDERIVSSFFFEQITLNFRLCLVRVQPLFSSASVNIKIMNALNKFKDEEDKIKRANRVQPENIRNVTNEIRGLIDEL